MSKNNDGVNVLKLSDPAGIASRGNTALNAPSPEKVAAEHAQLADLQKRITELEKGNAELEKVIEQREAQQAKSNSDKSGKSRHVAHAEGWQAVCTSPDFCRVGKDIIAFNSFATLDTKVNASPNVKARGTAVYRKGDVIKNVKGDAGKHVVSGTSLGSGHVKILDGHESVKVNGIPAARHDSRCLINCDASGVGGAQGKLITEQKSVRSSRGNNSTNPEAPPGKRTSPKLEALKAAREKAANGMLDLDAIDEYVNFKESNMLLDGLIAEIRGAPGTLADQAAQVARGVLGFAKDAVLGVSELAYEGIKAVPKLVQLTQTQSGQLLAQLDGKILAENIKLGNITAKTIGSATLDIGKAIVKPVTDPWAKGQYVESITRGATEIGTLGNGWLKGSKAAKAARAPSAAKAESTNAAALAKEASIGVAAMPAETLGGHVDAGVHIAQVRRRARPAANGFEGPDGYKTHGIQENPLRSAEGRKLVDQYKAQGMTDDDALKKAREIMASGSTPPAAVDLAPGDTLYKVTPEGTTPGKYSAYFATKDEIAALRGMSYDQITDRLGLPLESQQTIRFDVMEMTAKKPTTVFQSLIARTTQNGYVQPGGGTQSIVTNRSAFTDPILTRIKLP